KALNNNIKINEENLKEIGLKFKSNLSIDLKAILALIDSNDLDGLNEILEESNKGNIKNIKEFVNLMKNKSFGLLNAIKMIYIKLIIIFDNLNENSKNLIKKLFNIIINFFKKDVKNAYNRLNEESKHIIDTMIDDFSTLFPSSFQALFIGIKFVLNVDIQVYINDNIDYITTTTITTNTTTPLPPTTTTIALENCPIQDKWSEWKTTKECVKDCGLCGSKEQKRECLADNGCPCDGPTTQLIPCSNKPCIFGSLSCCSGKPARNDKGQIICN
ncbi:hypothetical protein Mgra_00001004, partial [Meloidogyne graminicola]